MTCKVRRAIAGALLAAVTVSSASAHPHIFIDTDFAFVFDETGALTAIRIDWTYDEFYSLLLVEDEHLDADGDGIPEQDLLDAFAGQDVDWEAGFPGDFTVEWRGEVLALSGPRDHAVRYASGRVTTTHIRPLETPVRPDGDTIVARSYDPTYFVAYDVPQDPVVTGREDCRIARDSADREKAVKEYGDRLAAIDMSGDPFEEVEVPDIGILFADSFSLTCAAGF